MTEPNLAEVLRKLASEGDHNMATHVDGCWEWHPRCAMMLAADRLEALCEVVAENLRLRGRLVSAEEFLRAFRDDGAPGRVGRALVDEFLEGEGA